MVRAMRQLAKTSHPAFPVTIDYAFKQSETDGGTGTVSTGWETFLDAAICAGFAITGTWPIRTEFSNRMIGSSANGLPLASCSSVEPGRSTHLRSPG